MKLGELLYVVINPDTGEILPSRKWETLSPREPSQRLLTEIADFNLCSMPKVVRCIVSLEPLLPTEKPIEAQKAD